MNGRKGGIGVAERKLAEQVLQVHHRGSCRSSVGKYEEPALWMAAQAGDTKICQQLLAARAEVTRGGRVDAIDGRRPSAGMGKWYRFC